jgi:hypothetical protein
LASLILSGLFSEIEIVMLPVGHTHENIDQARKPKAAAATVPPPPPPPCGHTAGERARGAVLCGLLPFPVPAQAFRVISEALNEAGFVATLEQYVQIIRAAWKDEEQYVQILEAVFDYKTWVSGVVWETQFQKEDDANALVNLNTA